MTDICIAKYLGIVRNQNKNSAESIAYCLKDFEVFCATELDTTDKENPVCEVIKKLKAGTWNDSQSQEQPYDLLGQYAAWLVAERLESGANNERTVNHKISWARTLLEVNFVPISKTLFKMLVKSPKSNEPDISPIEKKTIVSILMALSDLRMRSYVMFLASMGWRASESLTMKIANLENFDIKILKFVDVPFINASGKMAKTKKGKRRQLTSEMARQIEKLLAFNYRERRIHHRLPDGTYVNRHVTLRAKTTDPLFAPYHSPVSEYYKMAQTSKTSKEDRLKNIYNVTAKKFRQTSDRLGIQWEGENGDGNRRSVTLHSLRRYTFSQCERVVSRAYADWHVGRKSHEYSKHTEAEISEDFGKVEPLLTFNDTSAVELKQQTLEKVQVEMRADVARLEEQIAEMRAASIRSHENREILDNEEPLVRRT